MTFPTKIVTKIVLVGRHDPKELIEAGFNVVAQKNVEFSLDSAEAERQFMALCAEANDLEAALVFQNVPGILAGVFFRKASLFQEYYNMPAIGVVISRPGPRLAGVTKEFYVEDPDNRNDVIAAIQFANSRAKCEMSQETPCFVQVTVDPVSPFEFVRVEWF